MKKEAKIIILSGQSNAGGVGHARYLNLHYPQEKIDEFYRGYDKVQINYYSHDIKSDGFVPTTVGCTEISRATVGPELGMAEYLSEKYPDEEFFIVKGAVGGTSIFGGDWRSPSLGEIGDYEATKHCTIGGDHVPGWCYNELIHKIQESVDILKSRGYEPKFYAFCWMQGESEACGLDMTNQYIHDYDLFIGDVVSNFPEYFKDCLFVDAAIDSHWPYAKEMNEYKREYATKAANRRFVDTIAAGLTTKNEPIGSPDIAHYDSDCTIKLGRLFMEASEL